MRPPSLNPPGLNPLHSVRYMGTLPRRYNDLWALLGQDGGQSIEVDGRTLFVFSDTLLSARTPAHPSHPVPAAFHIKLGSQGVFLANTAGLAAGKDLRDAWANIEYYLDPLGFPREILPPSMRERAQGIRFWPEHGTCWNGQVYLYYMAIQTVDPASIWGFRNVGSGVARLDPASGECERISYRDDWRMWRPVGSDMHFGVQLLRDEQFCYVFGSVRDGLYHHAILARVAPADMGDPTAYTYLSSVEPKWSGALAEACDLGPCAGDFSVSFNAHLGRYLMLYLNPYEKILTMRMAEFIWGPYSEPRPIVGVPHDKSTEMVYLGFEHPSFTPDGGKTVFVSYCQPRFTNNSLLAVKFR
jgi:D-arabinan endo alpha-(1,5)-arabinofuranosidase